MKKFAIILTLLFGVIFLPSCEEIDNPVLDMSQTVAPQIISPSDGSIIPLAQEFEDEPIVIQWSPASYAMASLPSVKYILQMDLADNNFANPIDLADTEETTYETTVGRLNQRLMGMGLSAGEEVQVSYRVYSYITRSSDHTYAHSSIVTAGLTPYEDFVYVKPIYMLGNGTAAGWDNAAALEMYHIEDGEFALVARLREDGDMVKFISVLGAWAPQWGAQPGGTSAEGELAYRPTEEVPDPNPITITDLTPGDYRVVADTLNLTYSITKTTEALYLLGNATTAGWDNVNALPLTREAPGIFSIVTTLTAGEDNAFKFIAVPGQWAPQYGTDGEGTWESGKLVFRPTESEPDPPNLPAPPNTGSYLIEVNLSNLTYTLTAQ
ncbi:MAG: SusE domain-containing protein [Bacteroidales bacterium]